MTRQNGISADTYKRFVINSGAVYTGFVDFDTKGALIGATRGGNTVTIETEIKDMEVDGARGPVKGSRRITKVNVKASLNIIEHTLTNWKRALPGSTSEVFNIAHDAISRSLQLADADFLSDITIVGELTGGEFTGPCAFKLSNALQDGNVELAMSDKEEGVLVMQFTAHFLPTDLDTEPWTIYWPNT